MKRRFVETPTELRSQEPKNRAPRPLRPFLSVQLYEPQGLRRLSKRRAPGTLLVEREWTARLRYLACPFPTTEV